jgi:prevent-host-death family protein
MVKEIPAVRARQQFGGLLMGVATQHQHVVITKAEVPVAVMISTAEYHELMARKAAYGTGNLFTRSELTPNGGAAAQH